ncbi:hypothetical protein M0802_010165 [Mischocyttarus mexicanus]|nr:hypothetical protein M0802_010165 [Mischocyttarus mexicanus]
MNMEDLNSLALEALLHEAKLGAERAKVMGPSGWVVRPRETVNKRFINTTLRNAIISNEHKTAKKNKTLQSRISEENKNEKK